MILFLPWTFLNCPIKCRKCHERKRAIGSISAQSQQVWNAGESASIQIQDGSHAREESCRERAVEARTGEPPRIAWLTVVFCYIRKGMGCSQAMALPPVPSPPWDWAEISLCLRDPPQDVSHLPGSEICCLRILYCRRQVQGALDGPAWIWCLLLSSPLFYYPRLCLQGFLCTIAQHWVSLRACPQANIWPQACSQRAINLVRTSETGTELYVQGGVTGFGKYLLDTTWLPSRGP